MDDVGLQRAIINSLSQPRGPASGSHNPSTYFRQPAAHSRARDIAPSVPNSQLFPVTRRTTGRRNQLEREGIRPIAPAQRPGMTMASLPLDRYPSPDSHLAVPRSKSSSAISTRQSGQWAEAEEPAGELKVAPNWTLREPVAAEERSLVVVAPQSLGGAQMSLESPAHACACLVCTFDGGEEFARRSAYTIRCSVKLTTQGSELFFIVLDYKQRGREPGGFVSISLSLLSQTWRIERYSRGKRLAVFCECVDHTLRLNTWLDLRCVVRANGSRVSLLNGDQQVFKQVDVSQGASGAPGACGLGVFRGRAAMKDWQLTNADLTAPPAPNAAPAAPSAPRPAVARTGAGRATTKNINPSTASDGDSHLAAIIERDIMNSSPGVTWDSIAALEDAKRLLNEAVVLPLLLPEFFTGIREPWKGVLLFGPPGTGKTMLAKAVATCANTTFFNCSASSLVSKYHGESERLVRALFQAARQHAPSTLFFDEIDAIMMSRGSSTEHEASRRLKSELLSQIDGMNSSPGNGMVMVLATSNKPWDLDEALRRRLEKRIYIPLPDTRGRVEMFRRNLTEVQATSDVDVVALAQGTDGYSGADIHQVCRDACMMPMRRMVSSKSPAEIKGMRDAGMLEAMPVCMQDFVDALRNIRPSVAPSELRGYAKFQQEFGSL